MSSGDPVYPVYYPVIWDCNNNNIASDGCTYITVDNIIYAIKENYTAVAKYPNCTVEAIIPTSINYDGISYNVNAIAQMAFSNNCSTLTSVVIPDSIKSIGDEAFYGCSSLTEITIPDGVTSIGDGAFAGCPSVRVLDNNCFMTGNAGELIDKKNKKIIWFLK
jgi:hypothetical protein